MTRRSFLSAVRNAVFAIGLSPMLGPLVERDRDGLDLMGKATEVLQENYLPGLLEMLEPNPLLGRFCGRSNG